MDKTNTKLAPSDPKPVAKDKPKNKKSWSDLGASIAKWFREMRSELKKVVWPTRQQLIKNSLIAVVMMAAAGIVIGAFDYVANAFVFKLLISALGSLFRAS